MAPGLICGARLHKREIVGGKVDCVLAKGYQIPDQPFFFLQEYKGENRKATDPLGQLLAAMVVAQKKNNDADSPLYGCYVNGRMWFFVALVGRQYAISAAYDTTQEELYFVMAILRKIKTLFEQKIHFTSS